MALPPFVYSPFAREWDELDASDLQRLKSVDEGWHVEYKRDVPKADVAAKSISSFANSWGGWLFYGVETSAGAGSPATGFPGIADSDVPKVLDMLQKGCSLVSPRPFFETKILAGPDTGTGLPAGRSIVAVRVRVARLDFSSVPRDDDPDSLDRNRDATAVGCTHASSSWSW